MHLGSDTEKGEGERAAQPQEARGEGRKRREVKASGQGQGWCRGRDGNRLRDQQQGDMAGSHDRMVAEAEKSTGRRPQCIMGNSEVPGVQRMDGEPGHGDIGGTR